LYFTFLFSAQNHSDSSGVEDENAEESIIEREIRLQQEREQELAINRTRLANTSIQVLRIVVQ